MGSYNADGTRGKPGLVFERGQGSVLYDGSGREYLDWYAGIAVNALGHSDAGVAAVLSAQATKVQHVSNLYHTWEPLHLAEQLTAHSKHFKKVFLCNSGTEANEGALKLVKKAHVLAAMRKVAGLPPGSADKPPAFKDFACKSAAPTACITQGGMCGCWPQVANNDMALQVKNEVLAFKGGFHGRSMGSLAATHKPAIRYPFGPFPSDVRFARFNNIDGPSPASPLPRHSSSNISACSLLHCAPPSLYLSRTGYHAHTPSGQIGGFIPSSSHPHTTHAKRTCTIAQTCTRCGRQRLAQ